MGFNFSITLQIGANLERGDNQYSTSSWSADKRLSNVFPEPTKVSTPFIFLVKMYYPHKAGVVLKNFLVYQH